MPYKRPLFLFAFANDKAAKLRLDQEERAVREALAEKDQQEAIQYLSMGQTTLADIYNTFDRYHNRIYIFHYGGHSNQNLLVLDGPDARSDSLSTLIGQQDPLKLVFLNGCSNAAQVNALWSKGAPAVIATTADVEDDKASQLAERFYKALTGGKSIAEAFATASSFLGNSHPEPISVYRGINFREAAQGKFPWGLYVRDASVLDWTIDSVLQEYQRSRARIRRMVALSALVVIALVSGIWMLSAGAARHSDNAPADQQLEAEEEPAPNANLKDGKLAYYLPGEMYTEAFYKSILVISRQDADSLLEDILKQNPDIAAEYHDYYKLDSLSQDSLFKDSIQTLKEADIRLDSIKISEVMAARLIDPSPPESRNFYIEALTEEKQYVGLQDASFSFWEWEISPLREGRHPLVISVAVRIERQEGAVSKNIPVYRKLVYVESPNFPHAAAPAFPLWMLWIPLLALLLVIWRLLRRRE